MRNISVQTGRNLSDNNKPGLEEETTFSLHGEATAREEEINLNIVEKIEPHLSGETLSAILDIHIDNFNLNLCWQVHRGYKFTNHNLYTNPHMTIWGCNIRTKTKWDDFFRFQQQYFLWTDCPRPSDVSCCQANLSNDCSQFYWLFPISAWSPWTPCRATSRDWEWSRATWGTTTSTCHRSLAEVCRASM